MGVSPVAPANGGGEGWAAIRRHFTARSLTDSPGRPLRGPLGLGGTDRIGLFYIPLRLGTAIRCGILVEAFSRGYVEAIRGCSLGRPRFGHGTAYFCKSGHCTEHRAMPRNRRGRLGG